MAVVLLLVAESLRRLDYAAVSAAARPPVTVAFEVVEFVVSILIEPVAFVLLVFVPELPFVLLVDCLSMRIRS